MPEDFVRSALPRYGRTPRDLLRDPNMSDRAVRLYALLDDYAGADGRAFPSRATLAAAMGCSVPTVARELTALEEGRWLVRTPRFREDGGQTSTLVELTAGPGSPLTPPRITRDTPPVSRVRPQEGTTLKEEPPIAPQGAKRSTRPDVADDDPTWSRFWEQYPRKADRGRARKAWAKAIAAGADPEVIIAAARKFRGRVDNLAYCPHPSTWLNGERWKDDLTASTVGTVTPGTRRPNVRSKDEECPIHAGEFKDHCRGCAVDAKIGDR